MQFFVDFLSVRLSVCLFGLAKKTFAFNVQKIAQKIRRTLLLPLPLLLADINTRPEIKSHKFATK